ncbi:hypothetical protein BMS3Bbin10_01341 [bacterium BMS3Bbin10]|nr:hypothetical protein BMS3Bbin10_01341 [bacterium BMS3Bbin10]
MDQIGTKPQGGGDRGSEFSAVLTPHRSLNRRGFVILMAFVGVVSFIAGVAFLFAGAWPVFGFFGLDVLLIYYAFKLNFRAARAYEKVSIRGNRLTVTKVRASGRSSRWTFNPYWARVEVASRPGRASQLRVASHGRRLVLGAFLSEGERLEFARALERALHMNRHLPAV